MKKYERMYFMTLEQKNFKSKRYRTQSRKNRKHTSFDPEFTQTRIALFIGKRTKGNGLQYRAVPNEK